MANPGVELQDDTNGESLVCDLCDSHVDTPLSKCIDCDKFMCMICTKAHTRVKQTSNHQILTDQDAPSPRSMSVSDHDVPSTHLRSKPIYCMNHTEEEVCFYCYTCKNLICPICITGDHSKHRCSVINQAAQEISKELSKSLAEMKDKKMAKLSSKIKEVESKQQENKSNEDLNKQMITERTENFVNQINKIGEELVGEIQKTTEENEQFLTKTLEHLKMELSELEDTYTEYNNILVTGSDMEKIEAWINSESKLNKNLPPIDDVNIQPCTFVAGKADISLIKSSFGAFDDENGSDFYCDEGGEQSMTPLPPVPQRNKPLVPPPISLQETYPPMNRSRQPKSPTTTWKFQSLPPMLPEKRPPMTLPIGDSPRLTPSSTKSTTLPSKENRSKSIQIKSRIQFSFSLETSTNFVTAFCPLTDTSMLVHCVDKYDNYIVNSNGKIQGTVHLDFNIFEMVKVGNYIYATDFDNKIIHKLDTNGNKTQEINIALIHPARLCACSDGTFLVTMTDSWSYRIKKDSRRYIARIKPSGRELDSYEYDDHGKRMFTLPASVAENVNGDICVLNRLSGDSTTVVILDKSGKLKVIYKGQMGSEFDGRRLICDKFGHTIITDIVYNRVHLLDIKGQFICYLTTDNTLSYSPCALVTDMFGRLWIGCREGHIYVMEYIKYK